MARSPGMGQLLYAKWMLLRNLPQSTQDGGRLRIATLVLLGAGIWFLIYRASYWFFTKTMGLEPFGEILVRKMLGMSFLVIFAVLLFSNLIAAFSSFLLAEDLAFLRTRPIPAYALFGARFVETSLYSAWMVVLFGLAMFLAAGQVFDASWDYYLWLLIVLVPYVLIPTSLAVIAVMLLANLFPVQRSRETLVIIGAFLFVGVVVTMRSLAPSELFNPHGFGTTMEFFASLQTPGRYWLPSSWAIELVFPALSGVRYRGIDWIQLSCLYSSALGLYFAAGWVTRALGDRAYTRAQEGAHTEVDKGSRPDQASKGGIAAVRRWAARQGEGPFKVGLEIARKDALIFTRDTVQWSQVLMIVAIIVIYLVNFRYIGFIERGGIFGPIGVYFLNIGLGAFLVAALSVRVVFPAVSLEGRAFWLIKRAPISLPVYLRAKWLGHTPHMLFLAVGLTLASNWMIGTPLWLVLKSALLIAWLVVTLTGLGIGLGAVFPRFHVDNATKIAMGLGGILFMLLAIFLTLLTIVLDAYPTYHLMKLAYGYSDSLPSGFWWKASGLWLLALGLSMGSALFALNRGAKSLSKQ